MVSSPNRKTDPQNGQDQSTAAEQYFRNSCKIHESKIRELLDKLEDLKINETELKINNDRLIKMMSGGSDEINEMTERSRLWANKYDQLMN